VLQLAKVLVVLRRRDSHERLLETEDAGQTAQFFSQNTATFFLPDTWLWDTDCHGFDGLTHSRSIRDIRVPKDTKDFMIAATLL